MASARRQARRGDPVQRPVGRTLRLPRRRGVGFIVGDGRFNYGIEQIIETYYNCQLKKNLSLGLGFTGVNHSGYNRDCGPDAIGTVRLHYEF